MKKKSNDYPPHWFIVDEESKPFCYLDEKAKRNAIEALQPIFSGWMHEYVRLSDEDEEYFLDTLEEVLEGWFSLHASNEVSEYNIEILSKSGKIRLLFKKSGNDANVKIRNVINNDGLIISPEFRDGINELVKKFLCIIH